ncbi:MAG: transaldolase family protein [Candidatus Liptonbacteria bacterium]
MKPSKLNTKIFLDSGDPRETEQVLSMLGFLDGQTTNPSLIAKNPEAMARLAAGNKFSRGEVKEFYKNVIRKISELLPEGSVSVEVYADAETAPEEIIKEAREMYSWIPNTHIKLPINQAGLSAAQTLVSEGVRVNLTLCFSESQAAAVYAATLGAKRGQVYLSPFIGRLDDRGENGMDLIKNISELYSQGDGHVMILAASVRSKDHLIASIAYGADIITAPRKVLEDWAEGGLVLPHPEYVYPGAEKLKAIARSEISLSGNWRSINIREELTDKGLQKFADDWNAMVR